MKPKVFYWSFVILCIIVLVGCVFLHNKFQDKADDMISIIGSIASIAGIVFAIWQIHSLKSKTEAVSKALKDARMDMSNLTIFAEINKHSQFINEIENYIRNDRFNEALITYKDLKEKLSVLSGYIKNKSDYSEEHNSLKVLVDSAGGNIKTITALVIKSDSVLITIDKETVINNLEKIKSFLDETAGTLKGRKI